MLQKAGKGARRVLQIAIQLEGRVAGRETIAGQDRILKSKIARETHDLNASIGARDLSENLRRSIGNMVIGKNDFETCSGFISSKTRQTSA